MRHPAWTSAIWTAILFLAPLPAPAQESASATTPAADAAILAPRLAWGSYEARPVIESGLAWLARHQERDGSWAPKQFSASCAGEVLCADPGYEDYQIGVTALATLALLGYGAAPARTRVVKDEVLGSTPDLAESVSRALRWLRQVQASDGAIAQAANAKQMYGHAIATGALVEGYALCGDPQLRDAAQKAVDWLVRARNPGQGWRYRQRDGETDTSVTGWCLFALYLARLTGLTVPDDAFTEPRDFLARVTTAQFQSGYTRIEDAGIKVVVQGKNDEYANHPTLSAIAFLARHLIDGNRLPAAYRQGTAKLLAADPPQWDPAKKTIDYYYWYHATEALHQAAGTASESWRSWQKSLVSSLTLGQGRNKKACMHGSWSADTSKGYGRWAFEGGRVYATAIALLALEAPIRFAALPPLSSLGGGMPGGTPGGTPVAAPLTPGERKQVEEWTAALGGPGSPEAEASLVKFGPRAAEVLRGRLRDPDAVVRRQVRDLLGRIGADALAPGGGDPGPVAGGPSGDPGETPGGDDPSGASEYATPHTKHMGRYREDLKSKDIALRERAVGALAALETTWAVEPLVAAFQAEEQGGLRAQMIDVLLETEKEAVTREIRKATNARPTATEAARLLEFVARCTHPEAQRCGVLLFTHADAGVSREAGKVLTANRKSSIAVIVEAARASSGSARRAFVELLGEIRDKRAVPYLCSLCPTEPAVNPDRDAANAAIVRIGLPAVPAMIDALNTTHRKYVVTILRTMTGQGFGLDSIEKWKGWLKDNRDRVDAVDRERFPEDYK